MKHRFVTSIVSSILALTIVSFSTTARSYAQCGCSCAVVCDNRCEFECYGCGFIEGVSAAARCCEQARSNTPSEPCMQEGGVS
jgi:hypothetical protein